MEDEEDDDPEQLAELERLKEEILEDFLECAYLKKHEAVEEVKAECKRSKVAKDVEKKHVGEVQAALDAKRKEGMKPSKKGSLKSLRTRTCLSLIRLPSYRIRIKSRAFIDASF